MAWSAPAPSPTNRCRPKLNGKPLRMFLIGFEPGRPGGPRKLVAGREILRSHYEMIVDRSAGLQLGQEVPLGTRGHKFTVVGLMRNEVTSSGDPVAYITLRDAQAVAVRARAAGRAARKGARRIAAKTNDQINAVIAKVSPYVPVDEVATALSRWKHLTALTQDQQETLLSKFVIERARKQHGPDHGAAGDRIGGHHRADRLHADHGQGALDRHAQIRRRAGSDHCRPHRSAGAVDGDIRLLRRAGAGADLQALLSRDGWCWIPRASRSCSSSPS